MFNPEMCDMQSFSYVQIMHTLIWMSSAEGANSQYGLPVV